MKGGAYKKMNNILKNIPKCIRGDCSNDEKDNITLHIRKGNPETPNDCAITTLKFFFGLPIFAATSTEDELKDTNIYNKFMILNTIVDHIMAQSSIPRVDRPTTTAGLSLKQITWENQDEDNLSCGVNPTSFITIINMLLAGMPIENSFMNDDELEFFFSNLRDYDNPMKHIEPSYLNDGIFGSGWYLKNKNFKVQFVTVKPYGIQIKIKNMIQKMKSTIFEGYLVMLDINVSGDFESHGHYTLIGKLKGELTIVEPQDGTYIWGDKYVFDYFKDYSISRKSINILSKYGTISIIKIVDKNNRWVTMEEIQRISELYHMDSVFSPITISDVPEEGESLLKRFIK